MFSLLSIFPKRSQFMADFRHATWYGFARESVSE